MQKRLLVLLILGSNLICNYVQADNKKPLRFDFVNEQKSTQKLNELRAITTPEMIKAEAEYYRKLYQALIDSGFTKDQALKVVVAKASAN